MRSMAMKRALILVFTLSTICSFAQFNFDARENELATLLDSLRASKKDYEKKKWNKEFKDLMANTLNEPTIFDQVFTKLPTVGIIESPDHLLKIVNWNVEQDDKTQAYYAFVLLKDAKRKTHKVWELIDKSFMLPGKPQEMLDADMWYGALYYQIIPVEKSNKTYYTVLGWDGGTSMSNTKLIDVIHFSGNSLKLGAPLFKLKDETVKRMFFEHSERAYMSLKYEERYKRIIFDHLSPETPSMEGVYEFYVPDMSYDAFVFEGNKWVLKEDVIGVNDKQDQISLSVADPNTGEVKTYQRDGAWVDPTSSGPASKEVHVAVMPDESTTTTSTTKENKTNSNENKTALEIYNEKKHHKRDKGGKSVLGDKPSKKKKKGGS